MTDSSTAAHPLMQAAAMLERLAYRLEWSQFAGAHMLMEALDTAQTRTLPIDDAVIGAQQRVADFSRLRTSLARRKAPWPISVDRSGGRSLRPDPGLRWTAMIQDGADQKSRTDGVCQSHGTACAG